MESPIDPVERVLESLGGRQWPGNHHNPQLESMLMRSFGENRSRSFVARHRVLVPMLAVLLVAGVAFAAAGGIGLVRSWFVTVTVNGQVVDQRTVVANEDGTATFISTVPTSSGGEATISTTITGDGTNGDKTVHMTVESDGQDVKGTVTVQDDQP
jgi:hypothetical protein